MSTYNDCTSQSPSPSYTDQYSQRDPGHMDVHRHHSVFECGSDEAAESECGHYTEGEGEEGIGPGQNGVHGAEMTGPTLLFLSLGTSAAPTHTPEAGLTLSCLSV